MKRAAIVGLQKPTMPDHVLVARFWRRASESESGCWEWSRGGKNHDGYGRLGWSYGLVNRLGGERAAHRIAWILTHGPIPPGKLVMHTCDNPPCINPDHLMLGTELTNMQDKIKKGRQGDCRHTHKRITMLPTPPAKL